MFENEALLIENGHAKASIWDLFHDRGVTKFRAGGGWVRRAATGSQEDSVQGPELSYLTSNVPARRDEVLLRAAHERRYATTCRAPSNLLTC